MWRGNRLSFSVNHIWWLTLICIMIGVVSGWIKRLMVKKLEEGLDWVLMQILPLSSEYRVFYISIKQCCTFSSSLLRIVFIWSPSFRLGKMYRYTLEKFDPESMANFVEGFYKNLPAENIPPPKSPLWVMTFNTTSKISKLKFLTMNFLFHRD